MFVWETWLGMSVLVCFIGFFFVPYNYAIFFMPVALERLSNDPVPNDFVELSRLSAKALPPNPSADPSYFLWPCFVVFVFNLP